MNADNLRTFMDGLRLTPEEAALVHAGQGAKVIREPHPDMHGSVVRLSVTADPWHARAFAGTPAEGVVGSTGPWRYVWVAEDWCGNMIAVLGPTELTVDAGDPAGGWSEVPAPATDAGKEGGE